MLTIITPCYNSARFIRQCLEHVVAQKCPHVEHLVVDGGSTDGTADIIRSFAACHPHVTWLSEPDRGQSDAMNKGIARARHSTITFLNVDDYFGPGVLNRICELLHDVPAIHFLVGNTVIRDINGRALTVNRPHDMRFSRLILDSRLYPFPSNPTAYFYDKRLHDVIGPYAVDLKYTMDLEFLARVSRVAAVRYYDEDWGNFVMHDQCKTVTGSASGYIEKDRFLTRLRAELPSDERLGFRLRRIWVGLYEYAWQVGLLVRRVVGKIRRTLLNKTPTTPPGATSEKSAPANVDGGDIVGAQSTLSRDHIAQRDKTLSDRVPRGSAR